MNGPEAAERIAAHLPGIPTLFMTAYPEDVVPQEGLSADCLRKPFAPEDLLRRIAQAVGAGAPDS